MKQLVFDSSAIISISEKCLSVLLERLAKETGLKFIIPKQVEFESVLYPLGVKRFELNAVRIKRNIDSGLIEVMQLPESALKTAEEFVQAANSLLECRGKNMQLVHRGETESIALCKHLNASALVLDERNMRMLIESPLGLKAYMQKRQGTKMKLNISSLNKLREIFSGIRIIRSAELVALCYEKGLFEGILPNNRESLEAALYAVKFSGCAVSDKEITEYLGMVK